MLQLPHVQYSVVICTPKKSFGAETTNKARRRGLLIEKTPGHLSTQGMSLIEHLHVLLLVWFYGPMRGLEHMLHKVPGLIFEPEQITFYTDRVCGTVRVYRVLFRPTEDQVAAIRNTYFPEVKLQFRGNRNPTLATA